MSFGLLRQAPQQHPRTCSCIECLEGRALAGVKAQAKALGYSLPPNLSDAELRRGIRTIARQFADEGLEIHLLAAGQKHIGAGFILLL